MSNSLLLSVVEVEMAAKSVKKDVLTKLGLINDDQLEEILTDLDLTVSTEKRKKADAVFNAISRHLASDAVEDLEDDGLSIFLKVQAKLTEMLDEKAEAESTKIDAAAGKDAPKTVPEIAAKKEEPEVKLKIPQLEQGAAAVPVTTRIEYHKLKDFRIEGGTVNGTLSYRNVFFQMEKGLELGHSKKEVMNGVIKAMKPGVLRTYCESSGTELEYDELCELLQSYSGVENATLLLTRLHHSFQGDEFAEDKGEEMEVDFVLRMGALRKTVLKLAKEEGAKLDEEMVSKSFRHALAVGIRRDVIRLQVQSILTANESIPDRELLKKVNLIMAMDKENQKTKGQNAEVNALNYLDNTQRQYTPRQQQYSQRPQHYPQRPQQYLQRQQQFPQQPTEQKDMRHLPPPKSDYNDRTDALIHEMQMMNATMVEMADSRKKEMDEMRGHIRKLEQKFDDRDRSMGNQNNNKRRDPLKCKNCKDQNLPRCTHCVKCLEEGHKQDQCTKN